MTTLSPDFRLEEYAVSASHPDLVEPVPAHLVPVVQHHATRILQPIRDHVGRPVIILSGYRGLALNKAVGGSQTSQHRAAEAADITIPGDWGKALTRTLFDDLVAGRLVVPCGQVIYYPGRHFIHIALPSSKYPDPSFHVHWPQHGLVYREVSSTGDVVRLVDAESLADPLE